MSDPIDQQYRNRLRAIRQLIKTEIAYLHVHNRRDSRPSLRLRLARLQEAIKLLLDPSGDNGQES